MDTPDQPTVVRWAAIVYNPIKVDLDRLRASVARAEAAAGWPDSLWFPTAADDAGRQATRLALAQGASLVLVAGGDGTIRAVADVLRGSGVPLAIVPLGTGNLLARNLGLPLSNLDEATLVAFTGADKPMDVGVASVRSDDGVAADHVFLVMAGIGIDAQMVASTRPELKRTVGWLAYVDAVARVLPRVRPFLIRYSLNGRPHRPAHVSTILIGNCGLLPGNIQMLPDARIDDGILDVAMLQPKGVLGWLAIWRRVTWENGVLRRSAVGRRIIARTESTTARVMTTLRAADIRIVLVEAQEFEVDGDALGPVRSVSLFTDPVSLVVRVPAAA
ncbi:MAG TPA: diacylglycerol kinase family protein [Cryobacterium sp.]|nr:diacylglycerol kinase family protein [Cryobacterium sp.]